MAEPAIKNEEKNEESLQKANVTGQIQTYNPSVPDPSIENPKRQKYQLAFNKGEVFELFTWLKPIKLLGEGAYASIIEVLDERTKKKYAIKKN